MYKMKRTFPAFVFIEPKYFGADQNDDHPPHNIFKAEKLIADVYTRSAPVQISGCQHCWSSCTMNTAGFMTTWNRPSALPPDPHHEEWTFDRLGVRVPAY